jgi:hypothetical protein
MQTDVRAIRHISPRRVRAHRFGRLAVAVGLIVGGLAGAQPAGAAAVWSMNSSPNPAGSISTTLTGVACPTTTNCFAVGRYTAGGFTKTLIEHWNGSGWGSMPSPNPGSAASSNLSGIACPSTKSCFAVGSYSVGGGQRTLVEHWNGSAWGFLTGANPSIATDASLTGVSCPNLKGCFAVGSYSTASATSTLVEHWNGSEWGIQASPNPPGGAANLRSIACPSPKSCFAVGGTATGSGFRALAEHWNGASWGFLSAANPSTATAASLTGVACANTKSCFAVGNFSTTTGVKTLAEHWNGSSWSTQASVNPSSSSLSAVACPNTKSCFAVGNASVKNLVEHWNGSGWGSISSPSPSTVARLTAVTCPSPRICFAVGTYTKQMFALSLALRYR